MIKINNLKELVDFIKKLTIVKYGFMGDYMSFCYIYNLKSFSLRHGILSLTLKNDSFYTFDVTNLTMLDSVSLHDGMIKAELVMSAEEWDK